jgi:zinc D-Ala-D-Ala carboxypeptidase
MKLTANFTLNEFLSSPTATANKITEQFNPPQRILDNIRATANRLQAIRTRFGLPMSITSGYRCPRLNTAVGGARASEHLDALGVDISTRNYTQAQTIRLIEVAIELGCKRIGLGATFIHIGFSTQAKHPQNVVFDYQGANATPSYLARERARLVAMMRK